MSTTPKHSGLLSVNGAKYAKRPDENGNIGSNAFGRPSSSMKMPYDTPGSRLIQQSTGNTGAYRTISAPGTAQIGTTSTVNSFLNPGLSSSGKEAGSSLPSSPPPSTAPQTTVATILNNEPTKYWKMPPTGPNATNRQEDIVVIHVCDENQQLSRDFCCKRDILVEHMKYFQKFLSENDGNGYEDIDISVHCDVEIFEWLMSFIHEPDNPPKIDKSIMVSILISSEFLQMDKLVDLCINQMTQNMNEIIKLPIDLSCISEKLINRIASITSPKTLSEIRDRKDKILSKLYKRRVELDFSRKGSTSKSSTSSSVSKTIAASLTCCRYCGCVYLETYGAKLMCRKSPPSIDFRGRLVSRHAAIPNWSLTSYLKTLHSGGMGWDAIYWHVWAACIVMKVEDVVLSALEVDRYSVEPDGLLIKKNVMKEADSGQEDIHSTSGATSIATSNSIISPKSPRLKHQIEFSLDMEDDNADATDPNVVSTYKMPISSFDDHNSSPNQNHSSGVALTLNPMRPPEILTSDIFDLICTQMKYIVGLQHKPLIQSTMQAMIQSSSMKIGASPNGGMEDFYDILWSNPFFGEIDAAGNTNDTILLGNSERRRGRSPGRGLRAASLEPRKTLVQASAKLRSTSTAPTNNGAGSDSDANDGPNERRSRSSSMGKRNSIVAASSSNASKAATTLPSFSNGIADDNNDNLPVSQDPVITKKIEVLKSLPPDLHHRVVYAKGPIHGVWIIQNPLQIHPSSLEDMLQVVAETTTISDHKKMEWNLDLMREFDEKRMDRLERFLATKRNVLIDQPLSLARNTKTPNLVPKSGNFTKNGPTGIRGVNAADYYRDRGRQPYRIVC